MRRPGRPTRRAGRPPDAYPTRGRGFADGKVNVVLKGKIRPSGKLKNLWRMRKVLPS